MATITLVSSTSTSLKVRVSDYPSDTYYVRFYIGTSTSDMPYDGYKEAVDRTSVTYTFSGLDPETEYGVKILPVGSSNTNADRTEDPTTEWFWTEPEEPAGRPSNWSWTSTVSKGAEMDYTKISDTEYEVYPLTAEEWNDFVDRVVEFAEYCGLSIPSNYGSSWYVTRGTEMSATEVNYMRTLISNLPITVSLPAAATSNRSITAAYINGLKNSLNSIE